MSRLFGTLAALAMLLLAATGGAMAGNTESDRPAVAPPHPLESNPSALSPSALGVDTSRFDESADKPDLKIPNGIKFGNKTLRFDADSKALDSIPRVGLDATDRHVLPMQKDEDLPPTYFGLTLTAPTH